MSGITTNTAEQKEAATIELNDNPTNSTLINTLPIKNTNLNQAYKRIELYHTLLGTSEEPTDSNGKPHSKKQLLLKYIDLRLLNQQVRQADSEISKKQNIQEINKQRIFAIDPHLMNAYADCLDEDNYTGYSILKLFETKKAANQEINEERLALLALINDSINNGKVEFLLLDQGLAELSAHVNYLVKERPDEKTDSSRLKRGLVELIKAGRDEQVDIKKIEKLPKIFKQLEVDTLITMAYSVFPTLFKNSAIDRMKKLSKLDGGHFHSLENHPVIKQLDNRKKQELHTKLRAIKNSRCHFEVQREFRNLYRKFVSVVFTNIKTSAREYDNVDALFEIHCINTVLNDVSPEISVCYVSYSPKVTKFANLFKAGAIELNVIHPRFLPIYLNYNNPSFQKSELDSNINAILSASRFTKDDLLKPLPNSEADLQERIAASNNKGKYTLDNDTLNQCHQKVKQPLKTIENLNNITSGRKDLGELCDTIIKGLESGGLLDEISELSSKDDNSTETIKQNLVTSFEKIVSTWQENAASVSKKFKDDLINNIITRQLLTLKIDEIHLAPVIARKVEKNNDFKYVVFLPTLGSARYAFAIPFIDGEEWVKELKLGNPGDRAQLYSTEEVIVVFDNFVNRADKKKARTPSLASNRSEITQRLVRGVLCIATYHWSLAKTLFAEGKVKALAALKNKDQDKAESSRIGLLLQECQFFYQIAERGNIEHHFAGNMHAKQLVKSYSTIKETSELFISFHKDTWPFDQGSERVIHPMSARHTISCVMLILELLSSKKAIEIIKADEEKFSQISVFGVVCREEKGSILSDSLMALSLFKAVGSPADTLEILRKECIHAHDLLNQEYHSLDQAAAKQPEHSRILLTNRKMRFLQTAVTIDFIQQFGFYESLYTTDDDNVSYRNPAKIAKTWQERLTIFDHYKAEYTTIKDYILSKKTNLDVTHRLSKILCLFGDILYEPNTNNKSFKRLLYNDFTVKDGSYQTEPFPTTFITDVLKKLNDVDALCRRMPSSGFPRMLTHEMKIIVASKAAQFVGLVGDGIRAKYLTPYDK